MMIKDRMIILVEAQHRFFTLHNLKLSHSLPISKWGGGIKNSSWVEPLLDPVANANAWSRMKIDF